MILILRAEQGSPELPEALMRAGSRYEDRKIYIQVCDDLSSEQTQSREKAPLLSIRDAYPKMIIARTKHESYDIDGIRVVDIARWLRGDES